MWGRPSLLMSVMPLRWMPPILWHRSAASSCSRRRSPAL